MLLKADQRAKLDPTDDALFYSTPRFVTHVDEGFIAQLTALYRDRIPPNSRILDMMSSWVSHLPTDIPYAHVEGHGLNAEELARNKQLNHYFVQNLNENQTLPLADCTFDAVINTVSVQYIQYPEKIFAEVYRVLKPGGIAIFSFSNRMFYDKAISAWREGTEASRVALIKHYFEAIPGFGNIETIAKKPEVPAFLQMLSQFTGSGNGDPFYAVIAERMEPLVNSVQ
ncbi:MAG: SAM-dependent methyltransferase [Phormidesmis priestleyi]|uniref:SAM-dependent methyltransferase n=1 Tax=Phormidesmis priestleyi TaxID=268141 RepID=A0A2W4XS85_9CYAN|nr:MAG: SAM-dependent methyltransferase [Phormidesmis priestleyi]